MADMLSDISQDPDITLHILGNYIGSAYSPQVEVTETPTGHEVAITYDDATDGIITKEFAVSDGEDYVLTQADRTEIVGIVVDDLDPYIDAMEQATTRADSAERTRAAAESERNAAEQARQSAETGRDAAEGIRVQAEEQRASSERQRASSEASRASAEASRVTSEQGRVTAEQARASAETARAGEWATLKADAVTATSAANSAASSASAAETEIRAAATRGDFDGYSPTVDITSTTDEHTVTITDADGPHSYTVPTYASEEAARASEWADLKADAEAATEAAQEAATELAPEVAWLWGNQLTGELTGDLLTAADAYAAPPMALTVDGRSTQASTTGKNLFDKDNAPLGYYGSDGAFHSSGSASSGYRWWSVPVSEGDVIRWADSTNNYLTGWSGGTFVQLAATRPTSPFTVPSGVDEVRGYTQNSTLDTCIVTKNDADLAYEPYTGGKPSPNPDYPQPIESVDELTLAFAGKNLCGGSTLLANMQAAMPQATTGSDENGDYLRFTGAMAQDGPSVASGMFKPNTQYTFIVKYVGETTGAQSQIQIVYTDGTKTSIGVAGTSAGTAATAVVVSVAGKSVKDMQAYYYSGATRIYYDSCGIFEGVVAASDFVSYEGATVPIDLQDHVLRSLQDGTEDTMALSYLRPSTREGWAVYGASLVQRVGNVALTTSIASISAYTYSGHHGVAFSNVLPSSCVRVSNYCTHAEGTSEIWVGANDTNVYLLTILDDLGMSTIAEFRTWLADNPITVDYLLATTVTTDLGEIELPVLPAPNCTVWADPTTGLQMSYVRDTNLVIAAFEAALADLATS